MRTGQIYCFFLLDSWIPELNPQDEPEQHGVRDRVEAKLKSSQSFSSSQGARWGAAFVSTAIRLYHATCANGLSLHRRISGPDVDQSFRWSNILDEKKTISTAAGRITMSV